MCQHNPRHMSGGMPDLLVIAIGTMLIINAVHLHAVSDVWVCLFANIAFSLGVIAWLSLLCPALSELCRNVINVLSVAALVFYCLSFPGLLEYFEWGIHLIIFAVSIWYGYQDGLHESERL